MLIAVQDLQVRPVDFDCHLPEGESESLLPEIERLGQVKFHGQARAAGDGIRVQAHLHGVVYPRCARCLEQVCLEVERELDLLYQPESLIAENVEVEIHRPDTDVGFFSGPGIEVEQVAEEQLLLAVPMQPLCKPDCRGLCPRCGANWNQGPCSCPPVVDERWSGLLPH